MVKISHASHENEIHRVDRPFSKGFQKYKFLAREGLTSEEGQSEDKGKMAKNRETYCYANLGVINSNREY